MLTIFASTCFLFCSEQIFILGLEPSLSLLPNINDIVNNSFLFIKSAAVNIIQIKVNLII